MPWLCAVITCNLASWNQRQCCSGALRGSRAGCLHTKPTTTRFSTTSILQNISQPSSAGDAHILVLSTQAVYKQRSEKYKQGVEQMHKKQNKKSAVHPSSQGHRGVHQRVSHDSRASLLTLQAVMWYVFTPSTTTSPARSGAVRQSTA